MLIMKFKTYLSIKKAYVKDSNNVYIYVVDSELRYYEFLAGSVGYYMY